MFQSDKHFDDVNLDVIPQRNPKVDMKQVKEAREALREARSYGVITKPGYRLALPYTILVYADDEQILVASPQK